MMHEADVDDSGAVTFEEFMRILQGRKKPRPVQPALENTSSMSLSSGVTHKTLSQLNELTEEVKTIKASLQMMGGAEGMPAVSEHAGTFDTPRGAAACERVPGMQIRPDSATWLFPRQGSDASSTPMARRPLPRLPPVQGKVRHASGAGSLLLPCS